MFRLSRFSALMLFSAGSLLLSSCGARPVLTSSESKVLGNSLAFTDKNAEMGKIDGKIAMNVSDEVLAILQKVTAAGYDTLEFYFTNDQGKTVQGGSLDKVMIKDLKAGEAPVADVPAGTAYTDNTELVVYFADSAKPVEKDTNPVNSSAIASVTDYYASAEPTVTAVNEPETFSADLSVVYFDYDKSSVKEEYQNMLVSELKDKKAELSNASALVSGFCDERGTQEYNLALGSRRAAAVKRILVGAGFKAAKVKVTSFGEERPVSTEQNEEGWAKNRRVETNYSISIGK